MLSDAKNSGPDRYPMVNTNSPKSSDLSNGGMTNAPSCPIKTATIRMHAEEPIANPRMRIRPSIVPIASARRRNASGAFLMAYSTHAMDQLPAPLEVIYDAWAMFDFDA